MSDLRAGVRYFMEGLSLIRKPSLRRFVLMPLLVNLLLFGSMTWWIFGWVGEVTQYLMANLPAWLQWLRYLVVPVFVLTSLVVFFYTFSMVANLIAAPFNGLLAEAVECHLTGKTLEGDWRTVVADIGPSVLSELHKLLYFLLRAIPLLLLMMIPILNLAVSVIWILFSAWMLAVQYADFPMSNHHIFFKDQRLRLRKRPLLAWSFGGAVLLMTMIPILNLFVIPTAVAGATSMWVREQSLQQTAP